MSSPPKDGNGTKVLESAMYECVRCGTPVSGAELARLPSPTCSNCGYRTFRKTRGSEPKNLKAE